MMKILYNNVLDKYKKIPSPVKASLWFTVCNIINKGIALLSTPILTRILSQEEYGKFTVYQSWVSIITIFASLNLYQNAYTKGLVKYEEDRNGLTSSLLSLSSLCTICLFVTFIVLQSFWERILNMSGILISAMFIEVFFMSAFEFWAAGQRFNYKYKMLVFLSILISAGSLISGIILIINTEYKAEARIFTDVFAKTLIGLILFILIIARGKTIFNKKYWKYALYFNLPLIPHFLSHFILNQSDRIMIAKMAGNGQAAIYSIAYSISMMMLLVTNAINNSFIPYTYKNLKKRQLEVISKNSKLLFIIVSMLCVLTMEFGPEIIRIFAGEKYIDAIWIIPPVSASVYFIFIYSMFVNIEYYFKKTTCISVASIICAILNAVLNFIFIKKYGYFAAGYTTLASYIILACIHYIFYRRIMQIEYKKNIKIYSDKIILYNSIIVVFLMAVMLLGYHIYFIRYLLLIFIILLIYMKKGEIIKLIK